ncbi:MAG: hypothetical protein WCX65_00150 [bacterium]
MKIISEKLRHFLIPACVALALACFSASAMAQETRVDLILDNGTVLIYKAKAAGYKEGQILNVVRDGAVVGTVEVLKMLPAYAQAKIVSGANAIKELDIVVSADAAKADAGSKAAGAPAKSGPAATAKSEPAAAAPAASGAAKPSSRGGGTAAATPAPAADAAAAPAAAPKRTSRRGAAAAPAADSSGEAAAPAADDAAPKRTSRRGAAAAPAEDEGGEAAAPAGDESVGQAQQPKVLNKETPYVIHVGYFFLNQELPGTVISDSPAPMFGIDYWLPPKKKNSGRMIYSMMYSRPVTKFVYNNQTMRSQFKMTQLSVGYIWDNLSTKFVGTNGMYGGVSVGYRTASTQLFCEVSCTGTESFVKKSLAGTDFHAILGYRFMKKYEAKFDYSIDEGYYSLDIGMRY